MKKKHIVFISIIIAIILTGIVTYTLKNTGKLELNKNKSVNLYKIPSKEKVFINGIIVPKETENIYLDESKRKVNKVLVEDGQEVKTGDVLFTYKNEQITQQIETLEQQIESNNKQKNKLSDKKIKTKKQRNLKENGDLSNIESLEKQASLDSYEERIDEIQAQIDSLRDELESLKAKEFTSIKSPMDGKLRLNDENDITTPYIVIDSNSYYVRGSVNERDQIKVKKDQLVDILIFSTNKKLTGKVDNVGDTPRSEVGDRGQNSTGSGTELSYYDVAISLDSQKDITHGFHVQSTVKLKEEKIKIPKDSIVEEKGKQYVFKVVDKKLAKVSIIAKETKGKEAIVTKGLKENDKITTTAKEMKEGIVVE